MEDQYMRKIAKGLIIALIYASSSMLLNVLPSQAFAGCVYKSQTGGHCPKSWIDNGDSTCCK